MKRYGVYAQFPNGYKCPTNSIYSTLTEAEKWQAIFNECAREYPVCGEIATYKIEVIDD